MTFGRAANDLYRLATQQITPAPVSKRQTCTVCKKPRSIGQFGVGEEICARCSGKPAGWRRGDL